MGFIKRFWNFGDKVTEHDLNRWEDGVEDAVDVLNTHTTDESMHVRILNTNQFNNTTPSTSFPAMITYMNINANSSHEFPVNNGLVETIRSVDGLGGSLQRLTQSTGRTFIRMCGASGWEGWREYNTTAVSTIAPFTFDDLEASANDYAEFLLSKLDDEQKLEFAEYMKLKQA